MHISRAAQTARREGSFLSDGITCRAWVYEPVESVARPAPCIVMAHGLGGTRDASLEPYALRFAAAGFFVVLFDYRCLGASDGKPRQLISPARHLEDWRAAIDFARRLPGVDATRIGLWGTSLSGGHVVVTAARDQGIAAISAQCPMLDGMASARLAMRRGSLRGVLPRVIAMLKDAARAAMGRPPHYVPLVAHKGELGVMASDAAYAGCLAIVPSNWRNEVAARIFFSLPLYKPLRHAGKVRCPTLLVTCGQDTIVSAAAAVEAARRIGNKARLVMLPIDHFDVYRGPWFERSSGEQLQFFKDALASDKPAAAVETN
jgi:fermentation-respiration switch protein FrsA (DUF1100 family)